MSAHPPRRTSSIKPRQTAPSLRSLKRSVAPLVGALIALLPGIGRAEIEPGARELARAVAAKLASGQTIKLVATHKLDAAIGVRGKPDKGPLNITLKRPNRLHVLQPAGDETREMAYDGRAFSLILPKLKLHSTAPLKAESIEQLADAIDRRFGFRPPLAELLASDMPAQLFLDVTSARVTGAEWVGFTPCRRLHFEQEGMTGDLWVSKRDGLPRRYRLTFTGLKGRPTWDIRLTKWELNTPVDDALFSKRPAPDSHQVQMLKSP